MCGISAILTPDAHAARAATERMLSAMQHRGPDDLGMEFVPFGTRTLGLGHRRLAIIDLSPAGHEPMIHPPTGNQLVFNGEIYNFAQLRRQLEPLGHHFAGHSDAEVLLHALSEWGTDAIPRLQGMFAFAFFDAPRQQLIVARDSLGIKPLYYAALPDGGWVFASEVRAILASGLVSDSLDRRAIAGLLAFGAVQHPATIHAAIRSVPPGHFWRFDADHVQAPHPPVRYWQFPSPGSMAPRDAAGEVRRTIEQAVRDHLVADVPLGIFLSSGIDSTIVAAAARRFSSQVRCFTVGFADNPDFSELQLAAETARTLGLPHVPIEISGDEAQAAASQWLAASDTPSVDGMNVYVISRAVRAAGITVALSGQGGDELFCGYPSFRDLPRLRQWLSRTRWMPRSVRASLAAAVSFNQPTSTRQKLREIAAGDGNLLSLYAHR
ncbi:MAG: asparagine synthase (glutamine-hydrolyzing), partial [Phycisphaerae bacterium]|nr:asparagine synthase (glutamine-hydrolyzing) [Phycisphaerae bacterium]